MTNTKDKINALSLYTFAAILCIGSLICSVSLFASAPDTLLMAVIFGAFGVALEGCKFAFFPIGWNLITQKRLIAGPIFLATATLLVFISMAASINFMTTGTNDGAAERTKESITYQSLKARLDRLDKQISTRSALAEKGIGGNLITKGTSNLDRAAELETEWRNTLTQIQNFKASDTQTSSAFNSLAQQFNTTAETIQLAFFIGLSALVEFCAVALLWHINSTPKKSSTKNQPEKPNPRAGQQKPTTKPAQKKTTPKKQQAQTHKELTELTPKAREVVQLVRSGTPPVVRNFTQATPPIRHPHVAAAFSFLEGNNEITRNGKTFETTQISLQLIS